MPAKQFAIEVVFLVFVVATKQLVQILNIVLILMQQLENAY